MQAGLTVTHYGDYHQPILFMVHPAGTLHTIWLSLIEHLQYDYHIIAPDLHYDDWSGITFQQLVHAVSAQIPQDQTVHAVGLGLGADLLLAVAMCNPQAFDSLTLIDALLPDTMQQYPPLSKPVRTLFRYLPDSMLCHSLLSGMHYMDIETLKIVKQGMAQLGKEGIFAQLNVYNSYQLSQPLESVTTPTLLFYGGLAHPMYRHDADRLYTALPESRLHIVPRADQGACFYAPDTFIAMLHDHIHSVSAPEMLPVPSQPLAVS